MLILLDELYHIALNAILLGSIAALAISLTGIVAIIMEGKEDE